MKNLFVISLLALVLTSCVIHVGVVPDGKSKYYSEVQLCEVADINQLYLSTGAADIELAGSYDNLIDIWVGYYESSPGDAIIYLENGSLKARSRSGNQVSIRKVSGEIPEWLSVKIANSSGNVSVSDMQEAHLIHISNASGNIALEDNEVNEMRIEAGSGNVYSSDDQAYKMRIRLGSGNVYLRDTEITEVDIESGSGNVTLEDSEVDFGSITSGSGDIILKDSEADRVRCKVGSGRVIHLD